jgi:hypothetical protein
MTERSLDGEGVFPLVGETIAAGVAQHVRARLFRRQVDYVKFPIMAWLGLQPAMPKHCIGPSAESVGGKIRADVG